MKKFRLFIAIAAAVVLLVSCRGGAGHRPNVSAEITIEGLSADRWTYFSLETGAVVGTSKYLDDAEDAEWAGRSDWDFAICGDYLKTNSGTSGKGAGGVQQNKTDAFMQIMEAPESGYLVDTVRVAR